MKEISYIQELSTSKTVCPFGRKSEYGFDTMVGSLACKKNCEYFVSRNIKKGIVRCTATVPFSYTEKEAKEV